MEGWSELYVMAGGAAAALAGLIFVAVSLNSEIILKERSLPGLAIRTLGMLIAVVLLCVFGLIPGQEPWMLGLELLILGVVLEGISLQTTLSTFVDLTKISWRVTRIGSPLLVTVPMILAGVLLLLGMPGALGWAAVAIAAGFIVGAYEAWVLLVEIRR